MADAQYELTTGSLIDTIFVFEIGGQYVNVNKQKGTIQNVFFNNDGIRIRLELGGTIGQKWTLEVSIDDNGKKLTTVPKKIEGAVGAGGGSWFDRNCILV